MTLPEYVGARYWLKSYPDAVPAEISIPGVSAVELVEQGIKKYPNDVAMIFSKKAITYEEFGRKIDQFAAVLTRWGVKKGDTVALLLPNCPQFAFAFYGAMKIGAMVTALSPLFTPPEVHFQLTDSNACVLVVDRALLSKIEPALRSLDLKKLVVVSQRERRVLPPREGVCSFEELFEGEQLIPPTVNIDSENDVAILQYTGGTTGLPKAAMLTHRNIVAEITLIGRHLQIMAERDGIPQPVLVSVLPWYHIYAQTVELSTVLSRGGKVVIVPTFDVETVLRTIQDSRANILMGISSMFLAFLNHPGLKDYNLRSLIWCNNGATCIPAEMVTQFERITGVRILEGYGLSEASPVTHTTSPYVERKIGFLGPPLSNTWEAIIDPDTCEFLPPGKAGELIVHGPQVMKGYWQRPQETAEVFLDIDGKKWLRTGDIGALDEDGYLRFLSRSKDLIKCKGHSVYSTEIEQVLYQHPAVESAAVIGLPDLVVGEIVKAFIVLKKGVQGTITPDEILSWARGRLARYKNPKIVEFRDAFPGNALGKVLRRVLRDEELQKLKSRERAYA